MYDAYAGVINNPATLPLYLTGVPLPPPGSSPDFAVAAAAHRTLSHLYPSQAPFFDAMFAGAGNPGDPGHAYGLAVADAILADRQADPGTPQRLRCIKASRARRPIDPPVRLSP